MDSEAKAIHQELTGKIDLINKDFAFIREILQEIKEELRSGKYATVERVQRIEAVVYGGIGLILSGVILAGLALIFR